MIAGIQVGKVASVDLEDGHAVVGMDIEPKYLQLIHPDATPAAAAENQPQRHGGRGRPGQRQAATSRTATTSRSRGPNRTSTSTPSSRPSTPTPASTCSCCVAGGAQGIGGRGRQLSGAFRRLQPFSHYIAELNRAVAKRRVALAQVIHDFGLLTDRTGPPRHRDRTLRHLLEGARSATSPTSSRRSRRALVEFPSTLTALRSALASADRFSDRAPPGAARPDPAGAGARRRRCKANEQLLRADDGADPRPDPPLHPPDPPGAHPRQAGRPPTSNKTVQRLRQRARRLQQLPQRARLQAEGLEAELPLLPALAQPQPQRDLQPRRRRPARCGAAWS